MKKEKTEREILSILNREIRASSGYIGGEIVSRRKRSLEYYLGKPFGNDKKVDLKLSLQTFQILLKL